MKHDFGGAFHPKCGSMTIFVFARRGARGTKRRSDCLADVVAKTILAQDPISADAISAARATSAWRRGSRDSPAISEKRAVNEKGMELSHVKLLLRFLRE
jgi:hypothetical protein